MTTKEITITATSDGYYGGNKAHISLNAQTISFGYSRGINVAVLDETTGLTQFCTSFDTLIGNSDRFADFIDSLPAGRIVALAVKGDAGNLSDRAKAACKSLGSDQIDNLQAYQSYALIGTKGQDPGTADESINWGETISSYTFEVEPVKQVGAFVVEAISHPSTIGANYSVTGGRAEIKLNGNTLSIEGGYQTGWNLLVLDCNDGQVKSSGSFDLSVAADADKFVETLEGLQGGGIVAIATQDYAGGQVDNRIKKACASIGSTMVSQLSYGGNWAIVGYKGAKPGKAVESLSPYFPAQYQPEGVKVKYWSGATTPLKKDLKLGQKLWDSGASKTFAYDEGVGIDGDYALVGDFGKGDAYMYRWYNGQWQLQQQLLPKGQQGGAFGYSVDLSGNFAIVGQDTVSASGKSYAGAAHIYQFKDGTWQHQQMLQPSDLKAGDNFGVSVAIDGKVAIVGAYQADVSGKDNCGAVYIFHLENNKWVQKAKLQPLNLGAGDYFGHQVGIDGNVAIVGAYTADAPGKANCGAAYIFRLENGQWQQQHKLQPLDLGASTFFGYSVAIRGDRAIVGAIYSSDVSGKSGAGAAYIYQLQDGIWQLYQKIQATDSNANDHFGYSVAVGSDLAIVGAESANAPGKTTCGAVYLFQVVNGKWEQKQKLQPSDLPAKGLWSRAISFDGSRAIISSYGLYLAHQGGGFAYICDVTTEEAE